jgi:hypothetical protein
MPPPPPPPPPPPSQAARIVPPQAAEKPAATPSAKKKNGGGKKVLAVVAALVVIVGAAGAVYFTGLYEKLPLLAGTKTALPEGVATAEGDTTPPAFTPTNGDPAAQSPASPTSSGESAADDQPGETVSSVSSASEPPAESPAPQAPALAAGHRAVVIDTARSSTPLLLESGEFWRERTSLMVSVKIPESARQYGLWMATTIVGEMPQEEIDRVLEDARIAILREVESGYPGNFGGDTFTMDLVWGDYMVSDDNFYMLMVTYDENLEIVGHTMLLLDTDGLTAPGASDEVAAPREPTAETIAPTEAPAEAVGEVVDLTTGYDYGDVFYETPQSYHVYFPNGRWLRTDGRAVLIIAGYTPEESRVDYTLYIVDETGNATFIEREGVAFQGEAGNILNTEDGTRVFTSMDNGRLEITSLGENYQRVDLAFAGNPAGHYTLVRSVPAP